MKCRVAVIGAGAVGLSCAQHLVDAGLDVVVIEQGQIASGSSGLNIGVVETQYLDGLWIALRVYARRVFDGFETSDSLEFHRCGYLRPAYSADLLPLYERSVELQRNLGVLDARVVAPDEIHRLYPDLALDGLTGGLFGPSDGYVDPHQYCEIVAGRVRAGGGRILTGARLDDAARDGSRWQLSSTLGTIDADIVVNAAGAWASRVGRLLGAPVDVVPQRKQAAVAHLETPIGYVPPFFIQYVPGSGVSGPYIRYERPDQLLVGLHTEELLEEPADPDHYPRGNSQEFEEEIAGHLLRLLPGLAARMRIGNGWSGLYPISRSGQPQVGPRPDAPGVIDAIGFGGSGLQASPAAGRLVADWISNGEPTWLPEAVSLAPTSST